jgi:hypothetical protein
MKNLDNIENKIEETLKAFEGINQAEPKAFFYTRLQARMERELLEPKTVLAWTFKPIYAYASLALVLSINIFTIITLNNKSSQPPKDNVQVYSLYDPNGL